MATPVEAAATPAAAETATTSTAAEAAAAPEVPGKTPLALELEMAFENAAIKKPNAPPGATRIKRETNEPAKPADEAAPAKADKKQPESGEKPVTQSNLSAGFAKLTRQQRAADRKEAELAERQAAIEAKEAEIASKEKSAGEQRAEWEKERAELIEQVKLFDGDELAVLEKVATKKGMSRTALYNRITARMANDGKLSPEDASSDALAKVTKELEALKSETAAEKQAREKREADTAAEQEKKEREAKAAALAQSEKRAFVKYVTKEEPDKYPLLSQEAPEDMAEAAYQIAVDYVRRAHKPPTNEMVAAHLERILRFEAHQSGQSTPEKTPAAKTTDPKPKPKPQQAEEAEEEDTSARGNGAVETAKPEAASREMPKNGLARRAPSPRTLTNRLGAERTGQRQAPPRDENERLERALAAWK